MRILARDSVPKKQQASRHPEVNQENSIALEPNNQILASPLERSNGLSGQLGRGLYGVVGPGQARIGDLDVLERAADELRLEADSDRLDFR